MVKVLGMYAMCTAKRMGEEGGRKMVELSKRTIHNTVARQISNVFNLMVSHTQGNVNETSGLKNTLPFPNMRQCKHILV